jgi:hypothetical protein
MLAVLRRSWSALRLARLILASTLLVVLGEGQAQAAVPMCSQDGRTIAAPPIGAPLKDLELKVPAPCKQQPRAGRGLPAEPGSPVAAAPGTPLRAVPVTFRGLAGPAGARVSVDDNGSPPRLGITRLLYRPPRV